MSQFPVIRTAIPHRRYRMGDYDATLLGEVESGDGVDYRYIMAFVQEGAGRPSFYVCSERNPPGDRAGGTHRLRMVGEALSDVLGSDDAWRNIDAFAEEALRVGSKALSLGQEQPVRLM